jgi:hypothetical protein
MNLAQLVDRLTSGSSADSAEKRSEAPLFEDLGQPTSTWDGQPIARGSLARA